MNSIYLNWLPRLTLSLSLVVGVSAAQAASKTAANKATLPANLRPVPEVAFPQSVFTIPSQPSEGRNPFFPQSTVQVVVAKVTPESPIESFNFTLNGITSPPKRTAMINGRTFEPGEEGEVRMPGGAKMLIKCEEIKAESAIINIGGRRRELHLRSGL
jgi:hypothetical protein